MIRRRRIIHDAVTVCSQALDRVGPGALDEVFTLDELLDAGNVRTGIFSREDIGGEVERELRRQLRIERVPSDPDRLRRVRRESPGMRVR